MNIEFNTTLNPSLFQQLLSLVLEHVINQGMKSLSQKQTLINEVLDQSYEIVLDDGASGHCLAVNADSVSDLRSELGHQLAEKSRNQNLRGIGAVVYTVPELKDDEILKISLRSLENEDTTFISQKHGGGGHRNASSFMLKCHEFEQWKVVLNGFHHSSKRSKTSESNTYTTSSDARFSSNKVNEAGDDVGGNEEPQPPPQPRQ
ncbi:hypothetical protein L2E82_36406 [Cichorium intybus]|uniref:Uncharacterized protein n=1 Tax=Cichorium intybus TaxID=13427 RepID=A0ACB9BRK5_CICIN|nr:hypothetical protein L2E82_36406 [Cichorium intybus]